MKRTIDRVQFGRIAEDLAILLTKAKDENGKTYPFWINFGDLAEDLLAFIQYYNKDIELSD